MPIGLLPVLQFVAGTPVFQVAQIPDARHSPEIFSEFLMLRPDAEPVNLDDAGKVALIRELIIAGLLRRDEHCEHS
jgi:hypothetical protein